MLLLLLLMMMMAFVFALWFVLLLSCHVFLDLTGHRGLVLLLLLLLLLVLVSMLLLLLLLLLLGARFTASCTAEVLESAGALVRSAAVADDEPSGGVFALGDGVVAVVVVVGVVVGVGVVAVADGGLVDAVLAVVVCVVAVAGPFVDAAVVAAVFFVAAAAAVAVVPFAAELCEQGGLVGSEIAGGPVGGKRDPSRVSCTASLILASAHIDTPTRRAFVSTSL